MSEKGDRCPLFPVFPSIILSAQYCVAAQSIMSDFWFRGLKPRDRLLFWGNVFHVSSSLPGCVVVFIAQNLTVNLSVRDMDLGSTTSFPAFICSVLCHST